MFGKGKKGASGYITTFIGVILGIFLLMIVGFSVYNYTHGSNFGTALSDGINSAIATTGNVLTPIFAALLNLNGTDNFLKIVVFILVTVIIVGTMDSVSIFGEENQGALINFVVGIIVAIIGVRFMPPNMWASLTAPSSAFVATIILAVPFGALFFVTMKVKSRLAIKAIWLFYLVFAGFLIYDNAGGEYLAVYLVFMVLAAVMMIFDASVRRFFRKEQEERALEGELSDLDALKRRKIRVDIEKWSEIIDDVNSSSEDKATANKKLNALKKLYGQDLSNI